LFINEMMLPVDNNNVEFTYHCVDWLRGEDKQRNYVLFVEDGRIQTKLDIPLKSVSIPLEEALKMLFARRNELLAEVEKEVARREEDDFFNGKAFELLNDLGLPPWRLLHYLALVGTLVLLGYGGYRLGFRHRFQHDPAVPLLAGAVSRNLPVSPLLEQRTEELLVRSNLWEPSVQLVQRWFARLGVERGPAEPVFEARGGWWQRRTLLGKLRRMWRLACCRPPQRISPPEMWRLQRELESLRTSWERGSWGVAGPHSPLAPTSGERGWG
jgi:hypothetical protein